MICDVCGRDNPERLTFCQECGKRLRVPTGSQPTPTPPQGLAAQPLRGSSTPSSTEVAPAPQPAPRPASADLLLPPQVGSAAPAPAGPPVPARAGMPPEGDLAIPRFDVEPIMAGVATRSDAPPSISRRASRPEAPAFAFALDDPRPNPTPPPQPAQSAPPPSRDGAMCNHCGASNPRTHRFCTTCGGTLGASTSSLAAGAASVAAGYDTAGYDAAGYDAAGYDAAGYDAAASELLAPVTPFPAQPTAPHIGSLPPPGSTESPPAPAAGPTYAGAAWQAQVTDATTDPDPPQVLPAPVLSIASQAPQVAATVTCVRCQGQCSAAARYCKYCGSLLEAQAPSQAPAAPSQAPAAPSHAPAAPPEAAALAPSAPPPGWIAAQAPNAAAPSASAALRALPLALIPPTTPPAVVWGPVDALDAAPPRGLGNAPTLPQPPQLDAAAPARPIAMGASSSTVAHLAAQAAPAAYPQQGLAMSLPQTGETNLAPPRANAGFPRLVVLRDDGSEGAAFPLGSDVVDLGRRDGDILLHDDLYVSPRHARFRREGDRVRVIDLASTNGIYVRLRGQHRLTSGNLILLGLEVLQFQLVKDAAPPASPHAPSAVGPRGRGGAAAPAAGSPAPGGQVLAVQPFGSDFDAIEATWAGRGNPWTSGPRAPGALASSPPAVAPPVQGLGQASQHGTLVFGSPASSRRASLHQRTIEGIVRDVYHLVRDEVVLGREGADIVFSADPFMSRRHAVIRRDPATDVYTLIDLESSNGTFVRIENDAFLKHGDEIRIGRHLFRFDRESVGGGSSGASAPDQASHA